jgi:hypothetical protein
MVNMRLETARKEFLLFCIESRFDTGYKIHVALWTKLM